MIFFGRIEKFYSKLLNRIVLILDSFFKPFLIYFLGNDKGYLLWIKIKNNALFLNNDDIEYVFQRNNPEVGIFSNVLVLISHLRFCKIHDISLSVDLSFFFSRIYHKAYNNRHNYWEDYFEPCINADNSKKRKCYSCHHKYLPGYEINNFYNQDVHLLSSLYKKYIRLKPDVRNKVDSNLSSIILPDQITLGVSLRHGYLIGRPHGHPIQPSFEMLVSDIDGLLHQHSIDKIFVVCEDSSLFNHLNSVFSGMCVQFQRPRVDSNLNQKKHTSQDSFYVDNRSPWPNSTSTENLMDYADFGRENEVQVRTIEYITEVYGLSRCDYLLAGSSSGVIASTIINGGNYKFSKVYSLGLYE